MKQKPFITLLTRRKESKGAEKKQLVFSRSRAELFSKKNILAPSSDHIAASNCFSAQYKKA
jgi:hypothetical protein